MNHYCLWGASFMFRGGPTCQSSFDRKGNGHMSITTALAAQRKRLAEGKDEGFTLIELLVVVIIIGILAAIAIPVFLGQQTAAQEARYESDLATAKVAYVSSLADTSASLSDFGFPTGSVTVETTGSSFCLQHTVDTTWIVDSTTAGPRSVAGGCP